jgi:hypothetical protein
LGRRSCAAACFLAGADFLADPFRADAALGEAFARARFSAGAAFVIFRLAAVFTGLTVRAGATRFSALAFAVCAAVTFSPLFAGAITFGFLSTSLPGGTAGAAVGAGTFGGAEFVLPFGRPPFLAN